MCLFVYSIDILIMCMFYRIQDTLEAMLLITA